MRQTHRLFSYLGLFVLLFSMGSCGQDPPLNFRYKLSGGKASKAQRTEAEHSFDYLLKKYVDKYGLVNYRSWIANPKDMKMVDHLVEHYTRVEVISLNKNEQKALYINAYNLFTLDLVLDNIREKKITQSITDLKGPWDLALWNIGKRPVTLRVIEEEILNPMNDARIHFAINCASLGCPPLLNRSFVAETLEEDLNFVSSQFVNSELEGLSRTKWFHNKKVILTSQLLSKEWIENEFTRDQRFESVKGFFKYYANEKNASSLEPYTIEYSKYDWNLNQSRQITEEPNRPDLSKATVDWYNIPRKIKNSKQNKSDHYTGITPEEALEQARRDKEARRSFMNNTPKEGK